MAGKEQHCGSNKARHVPHWWKMKKKDAPKGVWFWCDGRKIYVNPNAGKRGI